jgi:gamma-glutamyltranspeptidase
MGLPTFEERLSVSRPDSSNSFTAALAAPHSLASEAGLRAYRDGGNAIDAAIAAAAVLTVAYPHNVALGGDLIALVRTPDGNLSCVNASGWAAAEVDADELRSVHGGTMPVGGADTVTVPGGVRGWDALRGFGARLTWSRTLQPAHDAAHDGLPVAESLAAHIAEEGGVNSGLDRMIRPGGRPLRAGDQFVQLELAATFAALRDKGPDEFYEGDVAERMIAYLRANGSRLTAEDFASFTAETVAPLELTFHGLNVMTSPPNTQGFLLLRALRAVDESGIADPLGEGLGSLMEVFRAGNELRAHDLADPRRASVDAAALVHGEPEYHAVEQLPGQTQVAHGDTVGIAAADSDGYAVSLIQSVYHAFGSGLVDPATGILFQNRGAGFSLLEDSPNVIAPRKRPAHTLMPVITTEAGVTKHVLATMGGQGQPQILAQLLLRAMDGEGVADAIAAPRAIVGCQIDGQTADTIVVEADADPRARRSLAATGLPIAEVAPHTEGLGQANAIFIGRDRSMTAAADPRADGAAFVAHYPRRTRGRQ